MRKRVSVAILLVAGCGGAVTQPNVPCMPIVKHDTIRLYKVDTVVKVDTLLLVRNAWFYDQWRDTVVIDSSGNITAFRPDNHYTELPKD